MQPGMHPGMQSGMPAGMQPGLQPGIPQGMQQGPVPGGYGQSVGQFEALTLMPGDQQFYPTKHDNVQTMYDQSTGQFGALPPSSYAQGNMVSTPSHYHFAYPEIERASGDVATRHLPGNQGAALMCNYGSEQPEQILFGHDSVGSAL